MGTAWRGPTTLTIANGAVNSEEVDLTENKARRRVTLLFYAPATLTETIVVEVAPAPGGTYRRLQSGGSDVGGTIGDATVVDSISAGAIRLHSTTTLSSGARVFEMTGSEAR